MNFVKSTATAVALSIAALALPAGIDSAKAGQVVRKKVVVNKFYPRGRHFGWRHGWRYRHYHHYHGGGVVAAGVLGGLFAGAVVGSALAAQPRVVYAAPVRGTDDWYEYCSTRYPSFDDETGTYLSEDGRRHACK